MSLRVSVIVSLIFVLSVFVTPAMAEQNLTLNTADDAEWPHEEQPRFHNRLATKAFERAGVPIKILPLPGERALVNANQGIEDGNLPRVAGLDKQYSNLRMVPEKLMDFEFAVFSKNADIKIEDWDSLHPFTVAFVTGWKILEKNVNAKSITKVKGPASLFQLLAHDRTDVVIYEKWQGLQWLARLGITDVTILSPPLVTKDVFIYLHKKHENLVPVIARELQAMKTDGTYEEVQSLYKR